MRWGKTYARLGNMEAVALVLSALWERQRACGLTNAALAQRIGVHEATISRLKRGRRDQPHLRTVLLIVRAFPELRRFFDP